MEKKVKCTEQSEQKDSSNKLPSIKVTNKSKPRKVEQDNNSSSACNTLPDRGRKIAKVLSGYLWKKLSAKLFRSNLRIYFHI